MTALSLSGITSFLHSQIAIELYGNRFSPQHQMIVQAVVESPVSPDPWANVADDATKVVHTQGEALQVQTVSLELGTTFMILERSTAVGQDAVRGFPEGRTLSDVAEHVPPAAPRCVLRQLFGRTSEGTG